MPYTMSEAESFLCDGIRHITRVDHNVIAAKYKKLGDETIYKSATINGVTPNIAHMLSHTLYQHTPLPDHWKDAFELNRARIQAYMDELDVVANALAEAVIALVALKNSGITREIYPHPGAIPMGGVGFPILFY